MSEIVAYVFLRFCPPEKLVRYKKEPYIWHDSIGKSDKGRDRIQEMLKQLEPS